jgi:hypothetical protein
MEIDAIASVGRSFSNNDVTHPPRLEKKKRSVLLPKKSKLNEKEKLAENLVAAVVKLLG